MRWKADGSWAGCCYVFFWEVREERRKEEQEEWKKQSAGSSSDARLVTDCWKRWRQVPGLHCLKHQGWREPGSGHGHRWLKPRILWVWPCLKMILRGQTGHSEWYSFDQKKYLHTKTSLQKIWLHAGARNFLFNEHYHFEEEKTCTRLWNILGGPVQKTEHTAKCILWSWTDKTFHCPKDMAAPHRDFVDVKFHPIQHLKSFGVTESTHKQRSHKHTKGNQGINKSV